jgi:hypothetical protein
MKDGAMAFQSVKFGSKLWNNKPTRVAIEWVAGFVGIGLVLMVALILRLASSPLELNNLSPILGSALSDEARQLTTSITRTRLTWNNQTHEILLELEGVNTQNAAGDTVATLPRAVAQLKFLPLLIGQLSFRKILAEGANVNLARNADGQLVFLGTQAQAHVQTRSDWPLSAMLAGWPQRVAAAQDQINRLGEVTVRAVQLSILDTAKQETLKAKFA